MYNVIRLPKIVKKKTNNYKGVLKLDYFEIEERETGGLIANNRFQYQVHWALNKIIEMYESGKEFVLFMEMFEDIFIFDRNKSKCNDEIELYQIKTNKEKGKLWSIKTLTSASDDKLSFVGKMFDTYLKLEGSTQKLSFVSNLGYNINLDSGESKKMNRIMLNQVNTKDFNLFKERVCKNCHDGICTEQCKTVLTFETSHLGLNNYKDSTRGKLMNFLHKNGMGLISEGEAVYNTLVSEINKISSEEDVPLKYRGSISFDCFKNYIDSFYEVSNNKSNWDNIYVTLLHEGYKPLEIKKMKENYNEFIIESISDFKGIMSGIKDDIDKLILKYSKSKNIKKLVAKILSDLKKKNYYDTYSEEIFQIAIIAGVVI
jgi:hypothetical protein